MSETLIPLGDRIVVEPFAAKKVTDGGLALPESARVPPLRGKVIATGDKVKMLGQGCTVLYTAFSGTETEVGGRTVLVMSANDVLGIIRDAPSQG